MELTHIFGPENNPDEGLWSLKLDGEPISEFEKILEIWQDTEYMYACCVHHLAAF